MERSVKTKCRKMQCQRDVNSQLDPNTFKNPQSPIPHRTGIVKLSSHPNKSTASLALATIPETTLNTPTATAPVIFPSSGPQPSAFLNTPGKVSAPWNAN